MNYDEIRNKKYLTQLNELMDSLPEICISFFKNIEGRTSVRTRIGYANDLRLFFYYLTVELKCDTPISYHTLNTLKYTDIDDYMKWLIEYNIDGKIYTNGSASRARKLSSLSSFFNFCFDTELITSNPTHKAGKIKVPLKEIVILSQEEKTMLLDTVKNGTGLKVSQLPYFHKDKIRDYTIIAFLLETGVRISELTSIDIDDINFTAHKIKIIRKGGNEYSIYISDKTEAALKEYITLYRKTYLSESSKEKALFITRRGKRMAVRSIQDMLKKYVKSAALSLKISPHKLRATFGTDFYDITGDIYLTSDYLGHSSVVTAQKHYARLSEQRRYDHRNVIDMVNESTIP